ncbi:2676_t:CDS:2, partial [Funneliformis caledonium]
MDPNQYTLQHISREVKKLRLNYISNNYELLKNRYNNFSKEFEDLNVFHQSSSELKEIERISNFIKQHQELVVSSFETVHAQQSVAYLKQIDALLEKLQLLVSSHSVADQTNQQGSNSQRPNSHFDIISGDPDLFSSAQSPANPAQPINSNLDQFNSGIPPDHQQSYFQFPPLLLVNMHQTCYRCLKNSNFVVTSIDFAVSRFDDDLDFDINKINMQQNRQLKYGLNLTTKKPLSQKQPERSLKRSIFSEDDD